MMYAPGDYVVCRSGGIWRISQISGDEYVLIKHESSREKRISAESDEIVRRIAQKEMILDVIERVAFIRTIQAPNSKIRKEFFDKAMSAYDEIEWIKVIKTVYLRQQEWRVTSEEELYGQRAKEYLHGEISVLLHIPMSEVEEYISSAVSHDTW